jgi:hypothetical protein
VYQYVVLLDIDEVIMPLKHHTWLPMIEEFKTNIKNRSVPYAAFSARNIYFLEDLNTANRTKLFSESSDLLDIPPYFHILRHVQRSSHYTKAGLYVKSFFDTDHVIAVHNHFPLSCFQRCRTIEIDITLAHLQHYRKDCVKSLRKLCLLEHRLNRTQDTNVWRYKHELIERASLTLRELNFIA